MYKELLSYNDEPTFLGITFDPHFTFMNQNWSLSKETLTTIYQSLIRSVIGYSSRIIGRISKDKLKTLERIQNAAIKSIYNLKYDESSENLLKVSSLLSIKLRMNELNERFFNSAIQPQNPLIDELIDEYLKINEARLKYYKTPLYTINCFECVSYNNDNPECEDPFFRSENITIKENCLTSIPYKNDFYRATHCLKLKAEGHGYSYVIRTCVLDSGSGKMDQEIVRVSHCGLISLENFHGINFTIKFDKFKTLWNVFNGCLSVCNYDECNRAAYKRTMTPYPIWIFVIFNFLK
ncbi:unnamed protein product [Brachionus calyciflorus]|uniref:Uncharacterized protein n=1 Tax=Brachionus calyciflorus TaxID=104777 RepID=A0A813Q3S5_9BILA|nr:unnamed protein product [Brachionus calyciflorus]